MNNFRCVGAITSVKDFLFFVFNSYALFFSLVGAYWLIIELSGFFFPKIDELFKVYGLWGILGITVLTLWLRRPIASVTECLEGRDVFIQIKIGDFFESPGDFIIASTTSFDTSLENSTVSKDTLIGKFITKYFPNSPDLLNQQLERSLHSELYETLPDHWVGNKKRYSIGTVAKVSLNNKNCYLVGINNKNQHGNVHVHNDSFEDVKVALARTWEYVEKRGDLHSLVIALIGTGKGRIKEKRIEVAKDIIKSFIAANSSSRFCDKLTIVIHPKDTTRNINVSELVEFLRYQCRYTQFSTNRGGEGTAVAHSASASLDVVSGTSSSL